MTRTRFGQGVGRPHASWWVLAVLALVGGTAIARQSDAPVRLLVATGLVGVVLAVAAVVTPRPEAATSLVGLAGLLLLGQQQSQGLYVWPGAVGLGATVTAQVLWRRQQDRRPPDAATALLRVVHDDDRERVELVSPTAAEVRTVVEALDGRARTAVSVFRGHARLDLGGDAAGLLLVAQCDDTTARPPVWSVLTSGPDAWRRDEVSVRVARLDGHLPYGSLTPRRPRPRRARHLPAHRRPRTRPALAHRPRRRGPPRRLHLLD